MRLHVERQRIVQSNGQRSWAHCSMAQKIHFVRQADSDQGAARTLGAIFQRRWHLATGGDKAQTVDRRERPFAKLRIELNRHSFTRTREVQHPGFALIAVLFQDQALHAKLNALRIVGARRDMWPLAALVIDGGYRGAVCLDQIHLRNQAEFL